MRWQIGMLGVMAVMCFQGLAWPADPVAVLTEMRAGQGEVQVKLASEADWTPPQPLLALQPGDQVRAAGDARAVLVFIGGRGAKTVSSANSPFTVQAPTAEGSPEKAGALLTRVTQFLLGQPKPTSYQHLVTRRPRQPLVLSPRESKLLPGPVTFEWAGPERLRYTIRVLGPQGVLWQQTDVAGQSLSYADKAPSLRAGVRYTWELEARGHPQQRTWFDLLPASDAARVREALTLMQPGALAGYPQNTVLLMRAGLLLQERLYHEARRELLAGIAAETSEPALHVLLGHVYERVGLQDLAAEAFEEARTLSTHTP